MLSDVLQIRCPGVCVYALRDESGVHLIDGGFIAGLAIIEHALQRKGWGHLPLRTLLITHGHLDHIQNAAEIAGKYHCQIFAPADDVPRYDASYRYSGPARICGWLEAAGRAMFGYRSFPVDRLLTDNDEIPIWGGLRAIHLPGHTEGHTGFYSAQHRLLFCGDLFASFALFSHRPPVILNSSSLLNDQSISKALHLDLAGIAPNHCDRAPFSTHLFRLRALKGRRQGE